MLEHSVLTYLVFWPVRLSGPGASRNKETGSRVYDFKELLSVAQTQAD